jgi:hypothetical protein
MMADPLSITPEILSLVEVAIKLVVDSADMVNKTGPAHHEVAEVLKGLQDDLERLEKQVLQIDTKVSPLVSRTTDRKFNKLLQE